MHVIVISREKLSVSVYVKENPDRKKIAVASSRVISTSKQRLKFHDITIQLNGNAPGW